MLEALDAGAAKDDSVIQVLHELEDILEGKLGGTLGGILGIFFVSLRNAIEENISIARGGDVTKLWGVALHSAIV
ncbi:DAK2 domain-containing protein, partial [Clostridium perfringens]